MRKNKKIILSVIIFAFILLITTISNATETFTTDDGIVATKKVEGYNGSIEIQFSNIPLNSEGNYVWAIGETSVKDDIAKWYSLGDFSVSNKTAKISLVVTERGILNILRKTNTAYLSIKDTKTENYIVDTLQVDLTLPPYHAFNLYEWLGNYYLIGGSLSSVDQWEGATYNIKNAYYKFVKVTDESLINKYNEAVQNKTSIENVFSITVDDVENITDWENCTSDHTYPYTKIDKEKLPTDDGLYILYMKAKDADSKMVYGYRIWPLEPKTISTGTQGSINGNTAGGDENNKNTITGNNATEKTDPTVANKILPNTGASIAIIGTIVLVIVLGIGALAKYHTYKDVK